MSRTTRKPRWYLTHNDVSYINRELAYYTRRATRARRRRRTDEEYKAAVAEAEERYLLEVKTEGPTVKRWDWLTQTVVTKPRPKPYVSRYTYEYVPVDFDEITHDAVLERKRFTRDGNMTQSGRNKAFKTLSKKCVRHEWREMKSKILKDEDYDSYYPSDHKGKKYIWAVW